MKIFYVSNLANKHSYTRSIEKEFRAAGNQVQSFEMYGFEDNSKYLDPNVSAIEQMNKDLVRSCLSWKPDMVFVFKGDTVLKKTLQVIKEKTRPIMATWWVDDPFCHWDGARNIRSFTNSVESLDIWDHFFIFDTYFLPRLKRLGVNNPYYLPNATDNDEFFPVTEVKEEEHAYYGSELSFMGTPDRLRAEMLRAVKDYQIKLWGVPWTSEEFAAFHVKDGISNDEARKVYYYTQINLNCHFLVNVNGANVRTFDIPACKGFLLTDDRSDITERLFRKGDEVVTYSDLSDLKNKCEYFLKHSDERSAIAENAYKKIIAKHLYKHRIEEILKVIQH